MRALSADELPGVWSHHDAVINGVRLHHVAAGHGPLVVLLHSFPEFWYSWRYQIPFLSRAGLRVIAPDQRGYNLSEKPSRVADYRLPVLVEDVAGLIRHAGAEKAVVVGHDWGGVVAWRLTMTHPELVSRLVILNAPHPVLLAREMQTLTQLLRSWYVLFFRLPWLPELVCRWNRCAMLCRGLRDEPGGQQRVTEEDLSRYRLALTRPGALTAAINYYRAAMRDRKQDATEVRPIRVPTLVLWGERDRYLGPGLLRGLDDWVQPMRIVRFPRATHWVQVDEKDTVNQAILDFAQPLLTGKGSSLNP